MVLKKIGDKLEFNTQPIYHLTVRLPKINTFQTGNVGEKLIASTLKEERNRLHTKLLSKEIGKLDKTQ